MRPLLACVVLSLALLNGCSGFFSGFGAAGKGDEGMWGYYPITDGFHNKLPKSNARAVIWGGHPSSAGTAITWLRRQGIQTVERSQLQKVFDEQRIRLTHTSDDEAQVLRVGKLIGSDFVVFIDTPVSTGAQSSSSGAFAGQFGSLSSESATVYSTSIWIRGVDIETGEVLWSATARYPGSFANLDDILASLTCHALATAWGFRPPGKPDTLPVCAWLGLAQVRRDLSNLPTAAL